MPVLDELFEVSFEGLAVFGSMPILLVVGTELVLILGGRVTLHRLRPLEEGLWLDLAEELVDRLSEDRVYSLVGGSFWLRFPPPSRWELRPLPRLTRPYFGPPPPSETIFCLFWRAFLLGRGQSSLGLEPHLLLFR